MTSQSDLTDSFGQMFMLAYDGLEPTVEIIEFFVEFNIGGVILFADNYESPQHLRETCGMLQRRLRRRASPPLLIATDHEGGRVQRFRTGFTRLPPMAALGSRSPNETAAILKIGAAELARVGINMNLAPVADINPRNRNGAIGDRAFSPNARVVAEHVGAAVDAIQSSGVLACVKHFPGHGRTEIDSHRTIPIVNAAMDDLWRKDLLPFRVAIRRGVGAVMTGHVLFPKSGDAKFPASLSAFWIRHVLRWRCGFTGLVISDAIEMDGVLKHFSPAEAGKYAINAGTDIVIFYRIEEQLRAVYSLRRMLIENQVDLRSVADSLARITTAKKKLGSSILSGA